MTVGKVNAAPKANTPPNKNHSGVQVTKIPPPPSNSSQKRGGIKSISIKGLTQKVQQPVAQQTKVKAVQEDPIDPTWNELVTQEKLDEVWRRFRRAYEPYPRIHSIFMNHAPVLKSERQIVISLRNKMQETELLNERSKIMSGLRRGLKNAQIELNFEISLEDKGPRKAFTTAEKFKEMMKKNPDLVAFKKQFDLDLE